MLIDKIQSSGVVKFFNDAKGFGYITDDNTQEEIFVQEYEVDNNILPLEEGQKVVFEIFKGEKEDYARFVREKDAPIKRKPKIITFYSYKGGTGRSMALANMSCLLAREARGKVLMIDWDLEAPGLHEYFKPYIVADFENFLTEKEGLIEFMELANKELPEMKLDQEDEERLDAFFAKILDFTVKIDIPDGNDNLYFLKAGKLDADYSDKLNFNWFAFFDKIPVFFTRLAFYLREQFDYVLIDSRTGHTDTGGICTMLMPEKLVLVFTPNQQSLKGVLKLADRAAYYRRNSDDLRPLQMYPLPSRVEFAESNLRLQWKDDYAKKFTQSFIDIYSLPKNTSMKNYFDEVQLMYIPKYAYGEEIAVLDENANGEKISLQAGYQFLLKYFKESVWKYGEENEEEKVEEVKEDNKIQILVMSIEEDKKIADLVVKKINLEYPESANANYIQLFADSKKNIDTYSDTINNADIIEIIYSKKLMQNSFFKVIFLKTVLDLRENNKKVFTSVINQQEEIIGFPEELRNFRVVKKDYQTTDEFINKQIIRHINTGIESFQNENLLKSFKSKLKTTKK